MALTLALGQLDLSEFCRMQPGEGFDPADPDYTEPQFTKSPLAEGGRWIGDNVNVRELVWPLILSSTTKDGLHQLVRDINRELERKPLEAEWRDAGAADSTFFDVERGRLEIDYSFWRATKNHVNATLRLFVRPFGHTATERIIATAAGTGALLYIPLPAQLEGDVPPALDVRVQVGDHVPADGRVVVLSARSHPSQLFEVPVASLNATAYSGNAGYLVGGSGAHGSQYLAFEPLSGQATQMGFGFQIPIPTAHVGRFRLLGLARVRERTHCLRAFGPGDVPAGPTFAASALDGWQLVDYGVMGFGSAVVATFGMAVRLGLSQDPDVWGERRESLVASRGEVNIGNLFLLPEENTFIALDQRRRHVAADFFTGPSGALLSRARDWDGHEYTPPASQPGNLGGRELMLSGPGANPQDSVARAINVGSGGFGRFSAVLELPAESDLDTEVAFSFEPARPCASAMVGLARQAPAGQPFLAGQVVAGPSPCLALFRRSESATALVASLAIGSMIDVTANYKLRLRSQGKRAWVTLQPQAATGIQVVPPAGATTVPAASVGASHAAFDLPGRPVLYGEGTFAASSTGERFLIAESWRTTHAPSHALEARNYYLLSGQADGVVAASNLLKHRPVADARGQLPRVNPASPIGLIALALPFPEGPANDVLSVDVRVRERFRFSR